MKEIKDHQILYTKQMILAKLNGWKIVTRRPIKPQPKKERFSSFYDGIAYFKNDIVWDDNPEDIKCPYGHPGDQLWTKENYEILEYSDFEQAVQVKYKADGTIRWVQLHDEDWAKYKNWKQPTGKKSKLFMFKTLSRFWDEVTEINAERVQDITAEEIYKEGIRITSIGNNSPKAANNFINAYRGLFKNIWQNMYEGGPFDWNKNPWVFAVCYKPLIVNNTPAGEMANVKSETEAI